MKLALGVAEVGDVEDADLGAAIGPVEQTLDVQRLAVEPRLERGRGDDVVLFHRQLEALFLREELVHVEDAQFVKRRLLDLDDDVLQSQALAVLPGVLEDVGDQDVLAILERLHVLADQGQQGLGHAGDALAVGFLVADPAFRRGLHGIQDADRQAGIRAGGVDAVLGGELQPFDPVGHDPPGLEAVAPLLGHDGGILARLLARPAGVVQVDPGREVLRLEVGEGQEQVGNVALGVDDDGRDVVQHGLFQQVDAQAGLAGAGHADHDGVGGQVARVVVDHLVDELLGARLVAAAQVKRRGGFDKRHTSLPYVTHIQHH